MGFWSFNFFETLVSFNNVFNLWMWKVSHFLVFYFFQTITCYSGCLNLSCYISKKVQKKFLVGLKVCWSWGSGFFFKIPIGRTVLIFSCKTSVFAFRLKRIPIVLGVSIFFNPEGERASPDPQCWQPVHRSRWAHPPPGGAREAREPRPGVLTAGAP